MQRGSLAFTDRLNSRTAPGSPDTQSWNSAEQWSNIEAVNLVSGDGQEIDAVDVWQVQHRTPNFPSWARTVCRS